LINDDQFGLQWPAFLPDGKAVIVSDWRGELHMVSLASGTKTALHIAGNDAKYVADKYLVYNRDGRLEAIAFDADRHVVTGAPMPVLDGLRIESMVWAAQWAVSENGTLVYLPGVFEQKSNLIWMDRSGRTEALPCPAEVYGYFKLSPDGRRLAITIFQDNKPNIWIYDLARQSRFKFTLEGGNEQPVWSPDGKTIAFESDRRGRKAVFLKSADRKGEARFVYESESPGASAPFSWSPDGKVLLFGDFRDIWSLRLDSTMTREPLINRSFQEWAAAFSPDGRWVAYTSDEQAQYDIYVEPYPPTGESVQVSTEGGEGSVWSQNTNELFYRNDRKWMAVSFKTSPSLSFEAPRVLFEGNYLNIAGVDYDVSPDGQRFLLLKPIEASSPRMQLNVVTNWFSELRRKVPVEN
ncbi:MAG: hypothetical protein ACE5G1_13160, partial [bacterium]